MELLIRRLGFEAFGVWTLAQTIVLYVTTADLGVGPAISRFTSLNAADPHKPRQILFAATALYAVVGSAALAVCYAFGGTFVRLFSVPTDLRVDAVQTVHLIGWVTLAAMSAGALGNVLMGLERFGSFTWSNALGSVTFVVSLVVLLANEPRLQDAAYAALLQWSVVAVVRVGVLRGLIFGRGPRRPSGRLVRQMLGFSARLQAGVAATLINTQTDRLVIGAIAPIATLGQAGVATQVADAGRFLGYAAFNPIASRMAAEYGSGGVEALTEIYARQRRLWIVGLLGVTAVSIGAIHPAISAWLGPGLEQASVFAVLLIAGYGIGLLPNPAFGYLRAVGRPGLEGLFGVVTVALNIPATIILGVLFGPVGVVGATAGAYSLSTIWIMHRAGRLVPRVRQAPVNVLPTCLAMIGCAAATYVIGEVLVATVPRPVALVGLLAAAGGVLVLYLIALADLRPITMLRDRLQADEPHP